MMIDKTNKDVNIMTQCSLMGLNRSSYYHIPKTKEYDEKLIDEIVKIQEEIPTYGNRRVTIELQNRGFNVGRKSVKKLRAMLGLKTIYTAPKTIQRNYAHKVYPIMP